LDLVSNSGQIQRTQKASHPPPIPSSFSTPPFIIIIIKKKKKKQESFMSVCLWVWLTCKATGMGMRDSASGAVFLGENKWILIVSAAIAVAKPNN
jgi:hypothetical protein